MNDLKILLKNNFNIFIGRFRGKSKQLSYSVAVCLLLLGIVAIVGIYSYQAYLMYGGLGKLGLGKVCLFHGVLTSFTVLVIIGLMRVNTSVDKDADFLLSLPIKKSSIIISKTTNKYIFDFFFSFVLFLPYAILYLIYSEFSTQILVRSILLVFLLPFLSIGISYVFGFIVSRLFNKLRSGKLLKSLFSVLIYVVVLALMLIKTYGYGTVDPNNVNAFFEDRFFSNSILNFVLDGNIKSTILFLSITIIPLVLGLILYSKNFGKTFAGVSKVNSKLKFSSAKSELKKLVQKELSTYFTTVPWFVNTIIGPVMILALVIICVFDITKIKTMIGSISNGEVYAILTLILCGLLSATQISCCSISLEGKQLWILKSCPIVEKKMFLSKALLQVIICQPFILIFSVVFAIIFKLKALEILVLLFVPTLLNLISAFGGVLINLYFPILNWEDETKVVKQSLSVLLSMVMTFVLTLIPFALSLFLNIKIKFIALITAVLYLVALIVIISILFTKGVDKFRKLSN